MNQPDTTLAKPSSGDPNRLVWLDLLRITASLLIVMLNLSSVQLRTLPVNASGWRAINLYMGRRAPQPLCSHW